MNELQLAEGILARIRVRDGDRYADRAYLFLLAAIEYLQSTFEVRRHVSGEELAWACRDLALQRFGVLSRTVLECWGITSTADFGRIVYTLVEVGLLSAQPGDDEADFCDVFEFRQAFDGHYEMRAEDNDRR